MWQRCLFFFLPLISSDLFGEKVLTILMDGRRRTHTKRLHLKMLIRFEHSAFLLSISCVNHITDTCLERANGSAFPCNATFAFLLQASNELRTKLIKLFFVVFALLSPPYAIVFTGKAFNPQTGQLVWLIKQTFVDLNSFDIKSSK